jgi:hypothetical protein
MTDKDKALDLALEALEHLQPTALTSFYTIGARDKAITAIKQARSAPMQSCYCPNCEAMGKELAALKAQPAQLPTGMPRDEMLQYYSDYANLCAIEALRYQKRIHELETAAPAPLTDEQARDMPDCWVVIKDGRIIATHDEPCHHDGIQAVRYAPAARRQWVGLTDEEIDELGHLVEATGYCSDNLGVEGTQDFARAIEAKLRSKNGY